MRKALCIDDHQMNPEDFKVIAELAPVCAPIELKCSYLGRRGRRNFLWIVNMMARALTTWIRACDRKSTEVHQQQLVRQDIANIGLLVVKLRIAR